jgi:hypothetical protein
MTITVLLTGLLAGACATGPGHTPECPTCDNLTELLVGWKCVPIAQVAACGPDGHAHGTECHCFHGQPPTRIAGTDYCLQPGCEADADPDALACDEITRAPEAVTAVTDLADLEQAHVDLGRVAEIALPTGQTSYVHFGVPRAGAWHVYLDTAGALAGAQDGQGASLAAEDEGPNPDCEDLPEVWHVTATSQGPVVLRFAAGSLVSLRLVVYEGPAHDH